MLTRPLLRILAIAIVAAGTVTGTADAAKRKPCIPGTRAPLCTSWSGKVTFVADGDTIDVDIAGDGTSRPSRIRVTGINAMELTRYSSKASKRRGECHGLTATSRIAHLIREGHRKVRLKAQRSSSRTGGRLRRAVYAKIHGHWVDLAEKLVTEGQALWLPNSVEYAWNRRYSELSEAAAASGTGMWDSDSCGIGPSAESPLRMWVNWDADGIDSKDVNGEWAKIKNLDTTREVSLAGWWFRDSHHRRYNFPSWAKIPAGGTITVHIGRGHSSGSTFYWGQRRPVFENASNGRRAMGDGGYLFDPQGDMRAWMAYPCRGACARDPLAGALKIIAHPHGSESVMVKNVGSLPVDLEGYLLENRPFSYAFGPNTILAPGRVLVLDVGGSPLQDTLNLLHWGLSQILNDAGDMVQIRNFTGTVIACAAWGSGGC